MVTEILSSIYYLYRLKKEVEKKERSGIFLIQINHCLNYMFNCVNILTSFSMKHKFIKLNMDRYSKSRATAT